MLPDEGLGGVGPAVLAPQDGEQAHPVADGGHMVGHRQDAAGEGFGMQVAGGENGLLAGFAHGLAVMVLIDDGFAHHQHAQRTPVGEPCHDRGRGVPLGEGLEVARDFGRVGRKGIDDGVDAGHGLPHLPR